MTIGKYSIINVEEFVGVLSWSGRMDVPSYDTLTLEL